MKSSLQASMEKPVTLRETQIKTEQLQPSFKRLVITSTGTFFHLVPHFLSSLYFVT